MITRHDIARLKGLVNSSVWTVLETIALDMSHEIGARRTVGENMWETSKNAITNEAEQNGINSFLRRIIELIENDHE